MNISAGWVTNQLKRPVLFIIFIRKLLVEGRRTEGVSIIIRYKTAVNGARVEWSTISQFLATFWACPCKDLMALLTESLAVFELTFSWALLKVIISHVITPEVFEEIVNKVFTSKHLQGTIPARLIIALRVGTIKVPSEAGNVLNYLLVHHLLNCDDHARSSFLRSMSLIGVGTS